MPATLFPSKALDSLASVRDDYDTEDMAAWMQKDIDLSRLEPGQVASLISNLQSFGLRVVGDIGARNGGAGPADAGMLWIDGAPATVPTAADYVADSPYSLRQEDDGFGVYLQEAFWTWLTGASPARNIRLSASSGLDSLFDVVLQVLDLGRDGIRAIVEKVFGKEFMAQLDRVLALS